MSRMLRKTTKLIAPIPSGVKIINHISNEIDIIHYFTRSRTGLSLHVERLRESIKQDGMIWISWPKKSSGVATDMTEDVIREIILPLGLVDVKVIRKENRK